MVNLLLAVALLLAAAGLGRRMVRLAKASFTSELEELVFATGLGFGTLAYVILAVGLLGLLYRWLAYVLLAVLYLIFFKDVKACIAFSVRLAQRLLNELRYVKCDTERSKGLWLALLGLGFAFLALEFVASLAPVTYGDSLGYHLAAPKVFVRAHRMYFVPIWSWNFPFATQMLYMMALLLSNGVLARLIAFALTLLTGLAVFVFGRRHLHLQRVWALLASVVFYGTPLIIMKGTSAEEDAGLFLFTILALYALVKWADGRQESWLALSGMMAGWAASTKYNALIVPVCLGLFVLTEAIRWREWRDVWKWLLVFEVPAVVIASPWYLKNWIITGNPVWPLMYSLLGGRYWSAAADALIEGRTGWPNPPLVGLRDLILGPWQLTMPNLDRTRGVLLPTFLAFIPGLALVWPPRKERVKRTALTWFLVFVAIFYISWFVTNRNSTYFSILVPMLALASVYALSRIMSFNRWVRWVSVGAIATSLAFSLGGAVLYSAQNLPVVLGLQSEESFLLENTWYYEAIEWINRNLPADSYVLVFPRHSYYLDVEYFRAASYEQAPVDYAALDTPEELLQRLKELGFSHVFWDESHGRFSDRLLAKSIGEAGRVEAQLETLAESGQIRLIYEQATTVPTSRILGNEKPSVVRVYEIP